MLESLNEAGELRDPKDLKIPDFQLQETVSAESLSPELSVETDLSIEDSCKEEECVENSCLEESRVFQTSVPVLSESSAVFPAPEFPALAPESGYILKVQAKSIPNFKNDQILLFEPGDLPEGVSILPGAVSLSRGWFFLCLC